MQKLLVALPILLVATLPLWLIGIGIFVGIRQGRKNRWRILVRGTSAEAVITKVIPDGAERCLVYFTFQPAGEAKSVEAAQASTLAAVKSLGLKEGSSVRTDYVLKRPKYAFIKALTVAERSEAIKLAGGAAPGTAPASVYLVSYVGPGQTKGINGFQWTGDGDIAIAGKVIRFTAQRGRPFWFPKIVEQDFPRDAIANVEIVDNVVRCEIAEPYMKPRALQCWAVNAEEAKAIGAALPAAKTTAFVPQLAERADFNARLLEVTPRTPVTYALVGINVLMFLIVAALGGGILVPNPEVLIRLGSDYTPLTAGGEWWRLLTSTFLHFGLLHLAFNMWALWVNGQLAERLYGSTRYLTLYLVAGVAGSLTSFLWHPFVNGAGASGAIFGVLGALLAYFLRSDSGVPNSVLKAQRNAAGAFILVSLLNAARLRGVDNAAHLGGAAAGFIMGWLLCRPLEAKRDEQDWTRQWLRALAIVVGSVLVAGYYLKSGQWHPRVLLDPSGRAIRLAELATPPDTLGGVTLGMTAEDLRRTRGKPLQEKPDDWMYDSLDSRPGIFDVYLTNGEAGHPRTVWAVLFWGEHDDAPPGVANLLGFTRQDLVMRYGAPVSEAHFGSDTTYLYFANGLAVFIERNKVRGYGVYIPRQK